MSSFIISARKYRPQTFSQVQGQHHITTTLKNALKNQQLAQAFLFCGPKGTGKTSCARILAKAINCQNIADRGEPCESCTSCENIKKNRSINIYQLDAASHNSVEDIRNLAEQTRYRPSSGKKIFIIDEAHMLSNAAFHGLLKIVEEPPSYVVFIFATTEKHKVIDTILSRCQIFDFRYLPLKEIISQLQYIAKEEGITYEQEALQLIAHKAEGSLRDALSTFDLINNFEAKKIITYKATLHHLNLLDHSYYFKLIDALAQGNIADALLLYDEITRMSFRGDHFIMGLSEHLRNILTTTLTKKLPLLNPVIKKPEVYHQQAKKLSPAFLHHALHLTHNYSLHYKNAQNKRLHIEILLIQIIQNAPNATISMQKTKDNTAPIIHNSPFPSPETTQTYRLSTAKKEVVATTLHKSKNVEKKELSSVSYITNQQLNHANVLPHWQAYAKSIEQKDPAGFSIMNLPIKITDNIILIPLVHPFQEEKVAKIKPDLEHYLKKKLGNKKLYIKTTLQLEKQKPEPYSQQDKLAYLVKKNKHIATLQKKLHLET